MTSGPRLGWIGLGSMGLGMATNLQKHLTSIDAPGLEFFNRTMSRGDTLKDIGGQPAASVQDLVSSSDIIFMSLSDDAALEATLDAILDASNPVDLSRKIVVDTSTVHPSSSAKAQQRLAEKGGVLVSAPVFGASPVAMQGKLLWIIAGPNDAVEAINPFIVGVMGRGMIRLGEDVKLSSLMKTAGNFVTAGFMEVIAESLVFAEKTGLGTEAMEQLIEQQYGPLPFSMSKRMTTGAYMPAQGERPMSDLKLALKDVGHGVDCAKDVGARLDVAELALAHLKEADQISEGKQRPMDSSSLYGTLRQQAGLEFESETIKLRDGSGANN